MAYRGNVLYWAKRYKDRGVAFDDLKQIGYVAVLKARRAHEANGQRDGSFGGYVHQWISTAMQRAITAEALQAKGGWDGWEQAGTLHAWSAGDDDAAEILWNLTDDEARAVELHLGLDGVSGRTSNEVASIMGIDRSKAYRLATKGLTKLRKVYGKGA